MTRWLAGIPTAGRGEVRFDLLAIEGPEAGRAKFQRLVTDIVKATRTDAREIAANPGDWGIDTFVGQLAGGEVDIWQSKYFVDGMAESQHRQVRDSFHSARPRRRARISDPRMDSRHPRDDGCANRTVVGHLARQHESPLWHSDRALAGSGPPVTSPSGRGARRPTPVLRRPGSRS